MFKYNHVSTQANAKETIESYLNSLPEMQRLFEAKRLLTEGLVELGYEYVETVHAYIALQNYIKENYE